MIKLQLQEVKTTGVTIMALITMLGLVVVLTLHCHSVLITTIQVVMLIMIKLELFAIQMSKVC